uniref:PPUP8059 n=1 Tax=Poeciliopsis prolifica TaxID=188132 RepID=A0A0S7ESZ1_9TELE
MEKLTEKAKNTIQKVMPDSRMGYAIIEVNSKTEAQEQEWPPVLFTVCSCQMDMTSRVSLCNVCVRLCQTALVVKSLYFQIQFFSPSCITHPHANGFSVWMKSKTSLVSTTYRISNMRGTSRQ